MNETPVKSICNYGEKLQVSLHRPAVEVKYEFDREFHRLLVETVFARALPVIAGMRRECCLNLLNRNSLKVRRLNTRYGYDAKHMHAHIEIALVLKGSCRFLIKDRVYSCKEGDVVFVPPNQPHVDAYDRHDAGYELLWFLLYDARYVVSQAGFKPARHDSPGRYFYHKRIVTLPIGSEPAWHAIRENSGFDIDTLRELLLYLCYRTVMVLRRAPAEPSGRILAGALANIGRNFARPLSVAGIAADLGITPNYLSSLFTRSMGIPFRRYLHEVRLNHAQALLKKPALSVKEVGGACGFGSLAAFDRLFRQMFGMSPTAYRESIMRAAGDTR